MKFWKNIANTLDRRKRQSIASSTNSDGLTNDSPTPSATRRRRSQYSRSVIFLLKFMFFKMATKLDEISTLDLTVTKYGQI